MIIILLIPVYIALIWAYFYPEESMLFGERWMYNSEPEYSDNAIKYVKFMSLSALIIISTFLLGAMFQSYLFRLFLVILITLYVSIGGYKFMKSLD